VPPTRNTCAPRAACSCCAGMHDHAPEATHGLDALCCTTGQGVVHTPRWAHGPGSLIVCAADSVRVWHAKCGTCHVTETASFSGLLHVPADVSSSRSGFLSMQTVCPSASGRAVHICVGEPRCTSHDVKCWLSCFNIRYSAYIQHSLTPVGSAARKLVQPGRLLHACHECQESMCNKPNKPVTARLNDGVAGS